MFAFTPSTALPTNKAAIGCSSFTTALPLERPVKVSSAPTMLLRTLNRKTFGGGLLTKRRSAEGILRKAEEYMGTSVRKQYLALSNPLGTFSVQCTEGSIRGAADFARVRALNTDFRKKQASASKRGFDLFENRRNAIVNSHECSHEERQFSKYAKVAETYNMARMEYTGACARYASPESVEEAAMMRYMDIQQKIAVNPSGVYNIWCNEGAAKGQADDVRVAALNTAYRQGQKSINRLLDEKYQQRKAGFIACHGCNYEEGLVSNFPAIGASFRSKSYGY